MTTPITKEQLIEKLKHRISVTEKYPDVEEAQLDATICKLALAAMDAEPVAWKWRLTSLYDSAQIGPWRVCLAPLSPGEGAGCKTEAIPLYAAPPAPVVDADDNFYSWFGREWHEHYQQNKYTTAAKQMLGVMAESAWKAGRAAMLNHSEGELDMVEPVSNRDELMPGIKPAPELDSMGKNAKSLPGNSPVIPDGWIPVSERMPDKTGPYWCWLGKEKPSVIQQRVMMFDGRWNIFNDDSVTHWMTLPAAPNFRENVNSSTNNYREITETSTNSAEICWCRTCRPVTLSDMLFVVCPDCGNKRCPRANDHLNVCTSSNAPGQDGSAYPAGPKEVGSALEMGMARYGDAMQKLADGGD